MLYSVKLYTGITKLMPLALSTCVLFISLMQSVNRANFLNLIFTFWSLAVVPTPGVSSADIVPLASIYIHHYNHINWTITLKIYT